LCAKYYLCANFFQAIYQLANGSARRVFTRVEICFIILMKFRRWMSTSLFIRFSKSLTLNGQKKVVQKACLADARLCNRYPTDILRRCDRDIALCSHFLGHISFDGRTSIHARALETWRDFVKINACVIVWSDHDFRLRFTIGRIFEAL
jgi:hypothetical protein